VNEPPEFYQEFFTAFVWDEANGMRELAQVLHLDFGLEVDADLLGQISGVSLDGLTIVGGGPTSQRADQQGWIARLRPPG
jgi:hypothetical protein